MTKNIKLTRWLAGLRAALLTAFCVTLAACDRSKLTDPESVPGEPIAGATDAPSQAIAYAGGIPFGPYALPTSLLGSRYNGTTKNGPIWLEESNVVLELTAIKARGAKVLLVLAGNHHHYLDADGHFSLTLWKKRIDRFRGINFTSFITDGTIIGHYLIDEPNDASNWGGRVVSQSTIEEMARYSKQIWPGMATVTRAESTYLAQWSGTYRYLDAAWAQYVTRKGSPSDFIARNVSDAKRKGLALITGLNISKGGPNRTRLTPTQIKSAGSTLLSSTYPCAFFMWRYEAEYVVTTSEKDAIQALRLKALNRPFKTCRRT